MPDLLQDLVDRWQDAYDYWLSANSMVNRAMLAGNEIERLWWISVANDRAERCDELGRVARAAGFEGGRSNA